MRLSKLSLAMLEILQILKYSIRQERLSFTDSYIANEAERTAVPLTPEVSVLISEGKIDELLSLIACDNVQQPASVSVE